MHNGNGNPCSIVRYGNDLEAAATQANKGLVGRPRHPNNPKRVLANPGKRSKPPKFVGKNKEGYKFKITLTMKKNKDVMEWIRKHAIDLTDTGHPGGWAIPLDKLDEFNKMIGKIDIQPTAG